MGHLIVPVDEAETDEEKPAWIVDGQQRTAAIREADVDSFPVYVTAFITDSVMEQRSQFILVNSTKPLPKGLIHELLPVTPVDGPAAAAAQAPLPGADCSTGSTTTPTRRCADGSGRRRPPTGVIKDNSILKMLAMSIEDGALYQWFDGEHGTGDMESMLTLLKHYWAAVATVFPDGMGRAAAALPARPRRRDRRARLPDGRDRPTSSSESVPPAADFERELRLDRRRLRLDRGRLAVRRRRSSALERAAEHPAGHQGSDRPSGQRVPQPSRSHPGRVGLCPVATRPPR